MAFTNSRQNVRLPGYFCEKEKVIWNTYSLIYSFSP
nr:MAG TPA: hypothetical protein [Caudoviricetes sp.]DAZ68506.1 MAG TPA: hypothetical protein [Caudoviricetes sp.]